MGVKGLAVWWLASLLAGLPGSTALAEERMSDTAPSKPVQASKPPAQQMNDSEVPLPPRQLGPAQRPSPRAGVPLLATGAVVLTLGVPSTIFGALIAHFEFAPDSGGDMFPRGLFSVPILVSGIAHLVSGSVMLGMGVHKQQQNRPFVPQAGIAPSWSIVPYATATDCGLTAVGRF